MKPICLLLAVVALASAQEMAVTADPARSKVEFTLGGNVHTVHGTFRVKSGSVRLDRATGRATGKIVVDVLSGDTGGGARDKRMHKDILQSAEFPDAVFTPDKVTGKLTPGGSSPVEIHGILQLHGQSHEVALTGTAQIQGSEVTATAALVIPYVSWGMKNPSNFLFKVNDKLDLKVTLVGTAAIK